jgi:hypothetical protein
MRALLVASVTLASVAAAHAQHPAPEEFHTFRFINTEPTAIQAIYAIPSARRVYVVPDDRRAWGPNLLTRPDTITPRRSIHDAASQGGVRLPHPRRLHVRPCGGNRQRQHLPALRAWHLDPGCRARTASRPTIRAP